MNQNSLVAKVHRTGFKFFHAPPSTYAAKPIMKPRRLLWIAAHVLLGFCGVAEAAPDRAKPAGHQQQILSGWTVRVDQRLLAGAVGSVEERSLKLLEARLVALAAVMPEEALARLREIPIQIDLTHGELQSMQYHPSAEWLREHGYLTNLAKCVHVPDAAYFSSAYEAFRQPMAILHELAHAYHDRVLGFDEPRIRQAWSEFRDSKRYESVLMNTGDLRRHYGLTNPVEFFAEMTEAYFGENDFYPFVAGELQGAEPKLFTLLGEIWGPLPSARRPALGLFQSQSDVGATDHAGSVIFDAASSSYRVTGGGENMWATNDAFHFVWKKVSGDVTLAADITFPKPGGDPHRKGCLILRQNLDSDSAYADAAVHGDGLTSLQYREAKGARTYEIQSGISGPRRVRIEKRGQYVSMSVGPTDEELRPAGGSFRLPLEEPFYVGLAVCAHDNKALETAVFANVELRTGAPASTQHRLISTLETVTIASKDRRAVYTTTNHLEAPNWSRDGLSLYFNSKGRVYRLPVVGGEPDVIDTGFAIRCNNDHGLSPDGKSLVISDQTQERHSLIYILPITGGTPRRITKLGPSYWHGWSPDGRTLAYCAERNGEFDIYTIPAAGGAETRLTTAKGLDDGPDYSPDGEWIYFNSERSGTMQIWRMRVDGTRLEAVTSDGFNNWFPHPSPDGKWLVFLSYDKEVKGHPENKDVTLRLMPLTGGKIEVLAKLFGGQGTINVPSWSPDSRKLAFVGYQFVP
jgi:TolB protein